MKQRFILHLDMNSYFASVEQQANPLYRNKPLGVCAYLSPRGCIIASSKEAKKVGIKTGTNVAEAKKLYPKVILVENEPAKYRSTTSKIFSILSDYTDRIEPYSIDEAFLDLTGYIKNYEQGEKIISKIKQRIKNEVGDWLTCSAGLSWTRFLAKFASDICPADSHIVIDSKIKMLETFNQVELTEAWGIAKNIEKRLNRLGIYNLIELKNYPVANLMQALGKPGYYLWANANGIEIEDIRTQKEILPKSIGHSYCVPKQEPNMQYIKAIMMKLCEKTGRRLRQNNLEAKRIFTGYKLKYGGGYFKSKKLTEPLYTTQDIFQNAWQIISLCPPQQKIYMLAISVSSLNPVSGQLNMFTKNVHKNISQALDKINQKFGEYTVYSGKMWGLETQAKDRIGFRKSVDVALKEDDVKYF
jgi:DNA polymerase IV